MRLGRVHPLQGPRLRRPRQPLLRGPAIASDLGLRALALGGVVGPGAFVAGWTVNGVRRDGYSPVQDAISRLAEVGATTRPSMTAAFVAFGLGVPAYAIALRRTLGGAAWAAAAATGAATLAVAALPLGAGRDSAHGVAAFAGYASLVAVPLLAAPKLSARGMRGRAAASVVAGAMAAASLAATRLSEADGLWQRVGLTVVDAWIVSTAVVIVVRGRRAFARRKA